jgi:Cof subfamily protein (haloacid dehalogenase superfamily)
VGRSTGFEEGEKRVIKLFAADLDGTLLNAFHATDPVILGALRRVRSAGAHFSIATGRTLRDNRAFGFEGNVAVVCANGALVLGEDGRLVRSSVIDAGFVGQLVRAFPAVPLEYITAEHTYHVGSEEEHAASYARNIPWWRKVALRGMSLTGGAEHVYNVSVEEIAQLDVVKINAHIEGMAEAEAIHAFIAEHSDVVTNAPFGPGMIEVTAAGTNKGEAVAWLAGYLGVGQDEVAVYGDGGNDIEMLGRFAEFGHAYATSNGNDAAKAAAGNVIGSCALHAVPRHMLQTLRAQR